MNCAISNIKILCIYWKWQLQIAQKIRYVIEGKNEQTQVSKWNRTVYIRLSEKCLSFANVFLTTMHLYTNAKPSLRIVVVSILTEQNGSYTIRQNNIKQKMLCVSYFLIKAKKLFGQPIVRQFLSFYVSTLLCKKSWAIFNSNNFEPILPWCNNHIFRKYAYIILRRKESFDISFIALLIICSLERREYVMNILIGARLMYAAGLWTK